MSVKSTFKLFKYLISLNMVSFRSGKINDKFENKKCGLG